MEGSQLIKVPQEPPHVRTKRYITKSVCYHAALMANEIKAKAISTLTNSGYTAFQISAWRPSAHILVFTSNKKILSQLNLLWGVKAFYYDRFVSTDETIEDVNRIACQKGFLDAGDMLISLAAMPIKDKHPPGYGDRKLQFLGTFGGLLTTGALERKLKLYRNRIVLGFGFFSFCIQV